MNLNSNPVSKRLKTETNSEDEKPNSPYAMQANYSATGGSQVTISEDGGGSTFANIFTDDILPHIFDNMKILTVKNLLDFRLVNRCWRDAATSVLLKHNLCKITLHFNRVVLDKNGVAVGWVEPGPGDPGPPRNLKIPPPNYKYFGYRRNKSFLADLIEIISTSPKFPCNSIRFTDWALFGFGTLSPQSELNSLNRNQQDLFRFFHLYGKKIKKLRLGGQISREAMHKLLYVYMPHLSCLGLGGYSLTEENGDDDDKIDFPVFLPPPSSLGITEIVWGCHEDEEENYDFEKELISVCPNLSSIREVDISGLEILLEIGKSHLIQHLHLIPLYNHHMLSILQFSRILMDGAISKANDFIVSRFQLRKLSAMFRDYCSEVHDVLVKALSIILSVSKDTLECLELFPTPSESLGHLFIPPLPRLESLKLWDNCPDVGRSCNIKTHFRGDVIGEGMRASEIVADQTVNDVNALALQNHPGNANIPTQYFPRLRKVKLIMARTKYDPSKLMGFFFVESLGPSRSVTATPSDTLVSVTTLKWDTCCQQSSYDNINMSKLFPNVVNLKIFCRNSSNVPNWVWTFSKLEKCGISGLPQNQSNTNAVDSFFTGFSHKLCAAFESDENVFTELETNSAQDFERTRPYIGTCENLKELKIKFYTKLNSKFASKLTDVYGFQDVIPRTKIVFWFCAGRLKEKEIQESSQYLDSVAAHVEIQKY